MQVADTPAPESSTNWRRIYWIVVLNTVVVILLLWLFSRSFSV